MLIKDLEAGYTWSGNPLKLAICAISCGRCMGLGMDIISNGRVL